MAERTKATVLSTVIGSPWSVRQLDACVNRFETSRQIRTSVNVVLMLEGLTLRRLHRRGGSMAIGRKTHLSLCLSGVVLLLGGLAIWAAPWQAGADPGPKVDIGLQAVPKDFESSALSWVNGMECDGDSGFTEVSSAAATDAAGFAQLEPEGSTILSGAHEVHLDENGKPDSNQLTIASDSSPVYAVFLTGSCKAEGKVFTGARVLVNQDGEGMQIQGWTLDDPKDASQPFGAQFDQAFGAYPGSAS